MDVNIELQTVHRVFCWYLFEARPIFTSVLCKSGKKETCDIPFLIRVEVQIVLCFASKMWSQCHSKYVRLPAYLPTLGLVLSSASSKSYVHMIQNMVLKAYMSYMTQSYLNQKTIWRGRIYSYVTRMPSTCKDFEKCTVHCTVGIERQYTVPSSYYLIHARRQVPTI
jgi:hypothetical protein